MQFADCKTNSKFVSNVFLVAIFDATFADQMLKSDKCVLTSTIFWKMNVWALKKKKKKKAKNNANLEKYGISKMNLEFAILDAILDLTKYPKVT